jgi:hypothetical protein
LTRIDGSLITKILKAFWWEAGGENCFGEQFGLAAGSSLCE